ncbi:MAG TPA: FAD-dependent oxidoreductase [Solirubrobacteraceae bacterium]|jgi:L-aspartate oxidase|nr:FAD-dependent oxidoreductase [Solirubrobacteraceae bacterium]
MAEAHRIQAEVVVVGAGAAGLYAALTAARTGARVALVSASPLAETASYWAQGGLAAALAVEDSPQIHQADTERAGRGAVRPSAAATLCREAPGRVHDLEALGVRFDADRFGGLSLGLEGGHSVRRVVHAGGSATGRRVVRQLSAIVAGQPRIEVLEQARATSLLASGGRCRGLRCRDGRVVSARAVIIATGGTAALWARSTNPPGSQGTGILLAHRLGAALADLELVQFHPTAVIGVRGREGFLVTEAIRGEGATLLDSAGERFVDELAPRDEVARAISNRMADQGIGSVSLDMRSIDPALFPNVVAALADAGLDATRETIPVAPAAHYAMGGVAVDLEGRSTVPGLYAVGEAACTGLHGANRLASNSLSECFVFGGRAAHAALDEPPTTENERDEDAPATELDAAAGPETRAAMWRWAGLERTREGLEQLRLESHPLARLIATSALARRESRGAHVRLDHPDTDPALDLHHGIIEAGTSEPVFTRWT